MKSEEKTHEGLEYKRFAQYREIKSQGSFLENLPPETQTCNYLQTQADVRLQQNLFVLLRR